MGWRDHMTEDEARREVHAAGGRQAAKAGKRAEDLVDAVCRYYSQRGWACVRKRPTPTRVTGRWGGRAQVVHEAPAGVDYAGTVRGARPVHFEVKRSGGASLPLQGPRGPTLKTMQAEELAEAHALGAVAAVLVCIEKKPRGRMPVERWFWLPWPGWLGAVAGAEQAGRRSLGLDLLEAHGIECPPHSLLGGPDWLLALEAAS